MNTLVLGASGFIGSAVTRRLASDGCNRVYGLVRTPSKCGQVRSVHYVAGDVTDYTTLLRAMDGTETVICCTSFVGSDELRCRTVNDLGTRNVANAASTVGVKRVIYVSTASVYGTGPFRDLPVDGAPLRPYSPASRSRVFGEQHIRGVGGLVIRPHLIHGPGDRWFMPSLTSVIDRLGGLIDEGSALLSTISVDRLAAGIADLAQHGEFRHSTTVHINDPNPSSVIDLLQREHDRTGWPVPNVSISRADALERAKSVGINPHHVDMISIDHWFRNSAPA